MQQLNMKNPLAAAVLCAGLAMTGVAVAGPDEIWQGAQACDVKGNPGAAAVPRFKDYPATPVKVERNAPLVLDEFSQHFRSQLEDAIRENKPEFAGKYLVVRWSCGGGCHSGAVVDATTGKVFPFPVDVTSVFPLRPGFTSEHDQELHYRLDSRLMVFAGDMESENPKSDVVLFYEFTGEEFKLLHEAPFGRKAGR